MSQRSVLLLSSSGLHGFNYLEHAKEQITNFLKKKNVNTILFVPYALPDYDKYTNLVSSTITPWGFQIESIHTKSDPIEAVNNAQAIFLGGGNTFVLLNKLYEKNLMEVIRANVLQRGIPYIGSSAGTNLATRSIHTTNDMPMIHPPSFEALNLVPFNINAHYIDPEVGSVHKGESRDVRVQEFLDYYDLPVLALREGTSVLVDGDKAQLLGARCAKLFEPKKDTRELAAGSDISFLLNAV